MWAVFIYAMLGATVWRLRGGAFGDVFRYFFHRDPGTTLTRVVCSFMLAAPLVTLGPLSAATWIVTFIAMCIGYFHSSMGVRDWRDVAFMSLWGLVVCALSTVFMPGWGWPALLGLLAGPVYWACRRSGWVLWTEAAELAFGGVVGEVFGLSL